MILCSGDSEILLKQTVLVYRHTAIVIVNPVHIPHPGVVVYRRFREIEFRFVGVKVEDGRRVGFFTFSKTFPFLDNSYRLLYRCVRYGEVIPYGSGIIIRVGRTCEEFNDELVNGFSVYRR